MAVTLREPACSMAYIGWEVTDCRVTLTDCGYASPSTSASDFRRLTQQHQLPGLSMGEGILETRPGASGGSLL
jgi:hypothetical protein